MTTFLSVKVGDKFTAVILYYVNRQNANLFHKIIAKYAVNPPKNLSCCTLWTGESCFFPKAVGKTVSGSVNYFSNASIQQVEEKSNDRISGAVP
jgi:hypothetical protein